MEDEASRKQPKTIDLELREYRAEGVQGEKMIFGEGVVRLIFFLVVMVIMFNLREWLQAHLHLF